MLPQVVGSKYVRLFSPADSHLLYPNTSSVMTNTSQVGSRVRVHFELRKQVDVENVDHKAFPLFAKAPYIEAVLQRESPTNPCSPVTA